MIRLIPVGTNINFLRMRFIAIPISLFLIVGSFYLWFSLGESKYGIDYLGGHEVVVKVEGEASSELIRNQLQSSGLQPIVQAFEAESGEYSVRITSDEDSDMVRRSILSSLTEIYPDDVEIIKADFVGPTIGSELRKQALMAIIVGLLGMLAYISYRFEFAFALGAVVAIFHDVIVTMGLYLFFDMSISVATLAAALTIVGYSVNDTIVIFDRIREEIFKQKKYELKTLFNECINSTLSRTIITTLTTLVSALALLIYGGGALAELSLFLCIGLVAGTYSTMFIAAPVALAWQRFRHPEAMEQG